MNQPFPNGPASAISHHEEVAQIIAQQSIADSLRRAWRYASVGAPLRLQSRGPCAARTEVLAAAGRELSVEAMAGKEAPP